MFSLRVGHSISYSVSISPEKLFDEEGRVLDAVCRPRGRQILFAPDLAPEDRMRCLRHEFWHAWVNHNPRPVDEEAEAQMFAHVGEEFDIQLEQQGGNSELMKMALGPEEPADQIDPAKKSAMSSVIGSLVVKDRISCPVCGSTVMCGGFMDDAPTLVADLKAYACRRGAFCDICTSVITWWENCSPEGRLAGSILTSPPPGILRGADAMQYVRNHSRAEGGELVRVPSEVCPVS
jgi:hypothetical protein